MDDEKVAAPKSTDEPWDSTSPDEEFWEVRRIALIVHSYLDPRCAAYTFRADAKKGELILKIFDGRPQTTANLLKLYQFTRRRHRYGGHNIRGPIVELIESILVKEGAIVLPEPEKPIVVFESFFPEAK